MEEAPSSVGRSRRREIAGRPQASVPLLLAVALAASLAPRGGLPGTVPWLLAERVRRRWLEAE
eukprot:14652348-Heterocapsa_arctica.AAC.1